MNTQEALGLMKQLAKCTETLRIEANEEYIRIGFFDVDEYKQFATLLKETGIEYDEVGYVVVTPKGNLVGGVLFKPEDVLKALS